MPRLWTILLVLFCVTSTASAQWVTKPAPAVVKQTRGLVHETFDSPAMKRSVGYSVVLPPGYHDTNKRFPVVYWLHGGGGNETSSLFTAKSWEQLYQAGKIREVMLVYPAGFRSGYMDHADGKVMVESMIIKELIPHIDKHYRTIPTRAGRAVHGFSMGSSGALKFAIRYPDMFCSAVGYGGGAIDLENTKMDFVVKILKKNLNGDRKLIRANNTYHYLEKNNKRLRRDGTGFLLICGQNDTWKKSAIDFREALQAKQIACRLKIVPQAAHEIRKLIQAEGEAAALFQDEVFRREAAVRRKQ